MKNIEEAARILSGARREKRLLQNLPESCTLANDGEALQVQRRIMEMLGEPIGGWKASLPQPRGLFVAPLPASTIVSKSPCPIVLHDGAAKIEPEIAFMMGRDLPPREQPYEEADLREAIGKTHIVLELIGSRFSDPKAVPFPDNLADCIQNQALFVGAAVPNALEKETRIVSNQDCVTGKRRVRARHTSPKRTSSNAVSLAREFSFEPEGNIEGRTDRDDRLLRRDRSGSDRYAAHGGVRRHRKPVGALYRGGSFELTWFTDETDLATNSPLLG